MVLWRTSLDDTSIFSGPTSNDSDLVFVTTLGAHLFCLNSHNGKVEWKCKLKKSLFTSPTINKTEKLIFIGDCSGCLSAIDFEGQLKWRFETDFEKPIFSTATLYTTNNSVIFGCHDGFLYCVYQKNGVLNWKYNCNSLIYTSQFLITINEEETVLCSSVDGDFFLLNCNGKLLHEKKDVFNLKNSSFSSPICFKNRIFIGCRDNHIYSYKFNNKN
jgi:acyl-CoA synthetase